MFPIDWLKQRGTPFVVRSHSARQPRHDWHARRHAPTRLSLEILEDRTLPSVTVGGVANALLNPVAVFQEGSQLTTTLLNNVGSKPVSRTVVDAMILVASADLGGELVSGTFVAGNTVAPGVGAYPALLEASFFIGASLPALQDLATSGPAALQMLWNGLLNQANELLKFLSPSAQAAPSPSLPPAPTPTPSLAGTYSATLVPNAGSDVHGSQTVTLTLNADGSGKASVSPFLGTPLTFNFPAGTAQLGSDVDVVYTSPSGDHLFVFADQNADGSLSCISFDARDAFDHLADFAGATLNKQS